MISPRSNPFVNSAPSYGSEEINQVVRATRKHLLWIRNQTEQSIGAFNLESLCVAVQIVGEIDRVGSFFFAIFS